MAASGDEAIELFRGRRFDTALVDIKLPGRTGVETCQAMREIDPDARVVLMTGYIAQQFETWTKRSGALQVLQKPFDPRLVLREIESAREIC